MPSYFGLKGGFFFPQGLYNTQISSNNNVLYDFLVEDGFNLNNMRQLGFPTIKADNYLPEYSINYNCIGWAFGINADIEPVFPNDNYVTHETLKDFLNLLYNNYQQSTILNSYAQQSMWCALYNSQNNQTNTQVHNVDFLLNYVPQLGNVMFYFGTTEETTFQTEESVLLHAARYFDVSVGNNQWTSKVGESLLVSHDLVDITGETYGSPDIVLIGNI